MRREVEVYLDGEIHSPDRITEVESHLDECPDCHDDLDVLQRMKCSLRRLASNRPTDLRNASGLHAALGGRGMPITAFYDADGSLLHVDGGALPEQLLRSRLKELYGVDV